MLEDVLEGLLKGSDGLAGVFVVVSTESGEHLDDEDSVNNSYTFGDFRISKLVSKFLRSRT